MEKLIEKQYTKAFSDTDIKKLCDNKVKIIMYSKLCKIKDISQILKPHGACVILYETKQNYGHWCVLLEQKSGKKKKNIEHFDSYGMKPDDELAYIPENYKHTGGEDYPWLTYLLAKATSPKGKYNKVAYNDYPLQESKNDISTCGRWCGMRVVLKQLNIDQFIKLFTKQKLKPDWYVTALTSFI
jgi:hypothetical protein